MKWIKTSKRTPNYWFDYIVCDIDGNVTCAFLNENDVWIDNETELKDITHFAKLPLPPM